MKRFAFAPLFLLATACAATPDVPGAVEAPVEQAAESAVALGESAAVAGLVLTPARILSDSRCPINARCVHAGEIIVETRIEGPGWRETLPLRLDDPESVGGYSITLISAQPGLMAGERLPAPQDYRFAFAGLPPPG